MKKHVYPFGQKPQFSPNEKWFSFFKNDQWVLFDLTNKTETWTDSILSAQFALNGEITLLRHKNHPDKLTVYNNKNKNELTINHTTNFSISPDKENMVVIQQNDSLFNLLLVDLKQPDKPTLLKEKINHSSNFRWSDSGNLLAFYEETKSIKGEYKDHILHCLDLKENTKNKILYSEKLNKDYYLNSHVITFSKDETTINFMAFPKDESHKIIDPQIWRSSDAIHPPVGETYNKRWLISWDLTNGKLTPISDQSYLMATGDYQHFFTLNNKNYQPSFKYGNFYNDIISRNSKTGKTKIIDNEFIVLTRLEVIATSPKENYFTWIKEKDWWVYNSEKDEKTCITCGIKDEFAIPVDSENSLNVPYGTAFYSKDNNNIILTSKHNIWIYNFNDNDIQPLFKDNKNYNYQIESAKPEWLDSRGENYNLYKKPPVDLENGLFVVQYDLNTNNESLYLYETGNELKFITSSLHKISSPRKAGDAIVYTLSNYNLPPQIVYWKNGKETIMKQSNKQQQNYYWGHSELLTYPGPYGTTLKGILFYPGNYNPDKKYPVIFKIYSEVNITALKDYIPLTLQNSVGWNNFVFTTQDYFVFMPDISYKLNHTGESALKSVLAGVDAINKIRGVDTSRMGLFGHSFGGYEASYIATQTDKFKTIVCFAASQDLSSNYLSIDDGKRFNYFRFEHNQYRITAPYYSHIFLDNSPILQAHKINTPMLLIAGTNDNRVDWKNSIKMQLALTRLEKKSTLLLYKDEYHVFTEKHNQIDISKKMMEWFNYHLKDKSKPHWN
ncbi:alpha/beta hydrolase family protein [Gelidibacter maritimus]|uniref:S9 family peptidase n=1 Tax=Gelidibacter maritimus TaxID=2761487 RepID=A0A7W2M6Y5_9FLAO|nr:prolyl oligopeptidase family serine peptidase [Gelidibacter maritimus]MBA6153844.1 S9 family peptidase [Gelidibacter maritimus]